MEALLFVALLFGSLIILLIYLFIYYHFCFLLLLILSVSRQADQNFA